MLFSGESFESDLEERGAVGESTALEGTAAVGEHPRLAGAALGEHPGAERRRDLVEPNIMSDGLACRVGRVKARGRAARSRIEHLRELPLHLRGDLPHGTPAP